MNLQCTRHFHCNQDSQESYALDGKLEYIKCKQCGLIWRSPGSWSLTKAYGEEYFTSKNYLKNRKHKITKSGWILDMALIFRSDAASLLEVGCSVGNTLEAARNRKLQHLGIDISRYAVDFCRSQGLNAETKTLSELKDEGHRFDIIFMQHVLEHFEDPFETLGICRSLLNDNGLIIIIVPNSDYRSAEKKRGKHRFYSLNGVGSEHFVYFNYPSLGKVLDYCGFRVLQENYPLWVKGNYNPEFFANRLFRSGLSVFRADQELVVIAQKN
jgi:SAM-dependent methyltransferase